MTQKDKELLLKDLCARLPYGVKFLRESWNFEWDEELSVIEVLKDIDKDGYINNTKVYTVDDIKPYLFPLSSMTEEQKQYIKNRFCYDWDGEPYDLWKYQIEIEDTDELIGWFNKNHFDYRGFIEQSLALDATNLNIY